MDKTTIKIELQYNPASSAANFRLSGEKCYNEQMKKLVEANIDDENTVFVIVFPQHIKIVSSSYLLGLFENIYKRIGLDGITARFEFESSTDQNLKELLKLGIILSGH